MSSQASTYFSTLSATIQDRHLRQWQKDIEQAEASRFMDPASMDILAARPVAQNGQHASHEAGQTTSKVEEWIQLAIDIEEMQLVIYLLFGP